MNKKGIVCVIMDLPIPKRNIMGGLRPPLSIWNTLFQKRSTPAAEGRVKGFRENIKQYSFDIFLRNIFKKGSHN